MHMTETSQLRAKSNLQAERESWLAEQSRSKEQIAEATARLTLLQETITQQQNELGNSVAEAEKAWRDLTNRETVLAQREKDFVQRSIDVKNLNSSLEDKERQIEASMLAMEQSQRELDSTYAELQQKREDLVALEEFSWIE